MASIERQSFSFLSHGRLPVDRPGHYTVRLTVVFHHNDKRRGDGIVLALEDLLEASLTTRWRHRYEMPGSPHKLTIVFFGKYSPRERMARASVVLLYYCILKSSELRCLVVRRKSVLRLDLMERALGLGSDRQCCGAWRAESMAASYGSAYLKAWATSCYTVLLGRHGTRWDGTDGRTCGMARKITATSK